MDERIEWCCVPDNPLIGSHTHTHIAPSVFWLGEIRLWNYKLYVNEFITNLLAIDIKNKMLKGVRCGTNRIRTNQLLAIS